MRESERRALMNESTQQTNKRSEKSSPTWGVRSTKDLNYHCVSVSAALITPPPLPPIVLLIFIGYGIRDNGYVNEISNKILNECELACKLQSENKNIICELNCGDLCNGPLCNQTSYPRSSTFNFANIEIP